VWQRASNHYLVNQTASHDAASIICQVLFLGQLFLGIDHDGTPTRNYIESFVAWWREADTDGGGGGGGCGGGRGYGGSGSGGGSGGGRFIDVKDKSNLLTFCKRHTRHFMKRENEPMILAEVMAAIPRR